MPIIEPIGDAQIDPPPDRCARCGMNLSLVWRPVVSDGGGYYCGEECRDAHESEPPKET